MKVDAVEILRCKLKRSKSPSFPVAEAQLHDFDSVPTIWSSMFIDLLISITVKDF
jgi:hypothetical protein